MIRLSRILVTLAAVCLLIAISIKMATMGRIMPGPMPVNWIKLADTGLLFSIAISLLCLCKNK